jgi:hypothetical protein
MAHLFAVSNTMPSGKQAKDLQARLKALDHNLTLALGCPEYGQAACWIEAPDEWGASHMREKAGEARAIVDSALPVIAGNK